MTVFFGEQLDFILFFYGLAFILLGAVCFAVARSDSSDVAWSVLGAFAYLHGAGEWLDLIALIIGDTLGFSLTRTALMAFSYIVLLEFGRLEAKRLKLRTPERWIYLPLVLLVALGWYVSDLNGLNAFARYLIGFPGAAIACIMLVVHAGSAPPLEKRWLYSAAIGLGLYGLVAGAVVPPTPNWAGDIVNYTVFARYTGMPVQLVRGLLACFIAFAIWAYWGQRLVADVASARYAKFQRRQFVWTLGAMGTILVAGWFLTEVFGGIYKNNVETESRGDLNLIASRLAVETSATEGMVRALAGARSVGLLAAGNAGADRDRVNKVLTLQVNASGANEGIVLNRAGKVSAATPNAEVAGGADFSRTPYFLSAQAGGPGYHFTVEGAGKTAYYYTSFPIYDDAGIFTGVAVLKKSLTHFETDLRQFDRSFALIDRNGIVVLTNRPDLRFRMLWPLPQERRDDLAETYGPLTAPPLAAREIAASQWMMFGGERDFIQRRMIALGNWSLVTWKTPQGIFASRVLGIIITLQMTIMALVYLIGRERWIHDNVQLEKRLQLEELARKLDNRATTDPLTGLFNRRKFDGLLAGEISRAKRYGTPLSLVMYDVDHFKTINDGFGHPAGDTVLIELSRFVGGTIRNSDILARWGGEEFAILCPASNGPMGCQLAGNLRDAIQAMNFAGIGAITCSFGVAEYHDGDTPETLLGRADDALYRAKTGGRNRVELAPQPAIASPSLQPAG